MAKEFAKAFYHSGAWKACRKAYASSVGGLCERCYAKGIIKAGVIVHHKQYINPNNISNPNILLSFDNLELLCRDCHAAEHTKEKNKRYTIDDCGRVIVQN